MLPNILLLFFVTKVWGLQQNFIDFSLDFFTTKDVKFICLLTCGNKTWDQKFASSASKLSITMSSVSIDESSDYSDAARACLIQKYTAIGVFIDTKCPLFEDVLLFASENSYFDGNHKWLIVDNDAWMSNITSDSYECETNGNLSWLSNAVQRLNLSIDADVTLSLQKGPENNIYEVYSYGKIRGGNTIINKIGSWNNKLALESQLNGYKYYRRWNFNQSSLNVVAVMSTPPEIFNVDMLIGSHPAAGVAIITTTSLRVLEELKHLHNIRFNYTIVDRWIGDFNKNSSRVVANSLYFKEQDLTPLLRVTPEIFQRVGMLLPPLTSIETRYYYRIPTTGPGKFENQFLRPLTPGAWGCVTAVIILCCFVLFLTAKLERRPSSIQYAVFSVIATFCQQSRQLAVLVTGASCVLIFNYYTSSVVSWLLNGPPPSINSLEELLESSLSLIFQDIGYTRSWLQNPTYYFNKKNAEAEDKLRRYKVFNKKVGAPLLIPLDEGIEMVKAGGFAYHTEVYNANSLISKTFSQSELCELGSLESMEKTELYAAVPKDSPYKEFFNWNLLRLFETGIISRIQRGTSSPEITCGGSSPRALALGGAAPAFMLLAFGFFLSTTILLIERFISRNNSKLKMMNNILIK
ncbi:ionotropic receptor 75a-like isoform X2 [Choristoneura fumiferana]|uniref:ionotropic receptor 75a-like isoform X2 n=1 Tax=Choristoneura fumiferana TaxID=7141 RepID=UPI003D15B8E2